MTSKIEIKKIQKVLKEWESDPADERNVEKLCKDLFSLYNNIHHDFVTGDFLIFEGIIRIISHQHPDLICQGLLHDIKIDSALAVAGEKGKHSDKIDSIYSFVIIALTKEDQKRKIAEIVSPAIVRETEKRRIAKVPPPNKKK